MPDTSHNRLKIIKWDYSMVMSLCLAAIFTLYCKQWNSNVNNKNGNGGSSESIVILRGTNNRL